MFNSARVADRLYQATSNLADWIVEASATGVKKVNASDSKEFLGDAYHLYAVLAEVETTELTPLRLADAA